MTEESADDAPRPAAGRARPKPATAAGPDTARTAAGQAQPKPGKPSKADRLAAKAARAREAEARRAADRAAAVDAGRAPSSRGWIVATVVLSVVAAALVALLVIGYFSWQHQRDVNSARVGALKSAKSFAVDFGSYDYQHLDAEFAEVAKRMTPDFAKNYTETSNRLKPTLMQYKTHVTAKVQGAGVTSAGTSKAVVVLFLDQTVKTSQSSTARIDRNRLEIHLQLQKGKWLVNKLLAK
jgi:Mce-associated membrane protein